MARAVEPEELAPAPPPTTTVLTRARSAAVVDRLDAHLAPRAGVGEHRALAGRRRVGGCGSPSAAWLNSRMSSVRFTTAAPVARRLRSVRVPRKGLMTIRRSPHSTPIAPQLTVPSGLMVVTTVSMMAALRANVARV